MENRFGACVMQLAAMAAISICVMQPAALVMHIFFEFFNANE
jgi:hypothetical protein